MNDYERKMNGNPRPTSEPGVPSPRPDASDLSARYKGKQPMGDLSKRGRSAQKPQGVAGSKSKYRKHI